MARAGIGVGWHCAFANDMDAKKAAVYRANWGDDGLLVEDIAKVGTSHMPDRADLAWASFPCQDLSLAGNGAGLGGKRSGVFWAFWDLMRALAAERRKPRTIILENVCGLLTSRGGRDFAAIMETLAAEGFWVGALVGDAAAFVPQSRPRLFIIAIDIDCPVAGSVQKPVASDIWHPARLRSAYAQLSAAARSAWLWFSPPAPNGCLLPLADVVEYGLDSGKWHSVPETQKLLAMMTPVNRAKIDLLLANNSTAVGTIYKRTRPENGRKVQRAEVRFDKAGCLRTPGGGSSRQTIIVVDQGRIGTRLITPRETARLMGLPDTYWLPAGYNDAYHVTGDGVAVPVVRHLIQHIIEPCLAAADGLNVAA